MATAEIRLYEVPLGARETICSFGVCGKRIVFVAGKNPASRVPVSLTHPNAVIENGRVVRAPSHFTDCAGANTFSKSGRRK